MRSPELVAKLVSLDDTGSVRQMQRVSFADYSAIVVSVVRDRYLKSPGNSEFDVRSIRSKRIRFSFSLFIINKNLLGHEAAHVIGV